jgi:hypothetical protein
LLLGNIMESTLNPRINDTHMGSLQAIPQAVSPAAVSWPAVLAGAFVAAAVTLIFVLLGTGLGFATINPWPAHTVVVTEFAATSAIWLIVTQWISAAVGGYVAGRLRTRWIGTHTHEVFFRDTAHGLVTWAVATVLVAAAVVAAALVTSLSAGSREVVAAAAAAVPESADKAAAQAAVYTALSMLVGAFIASVSAALGGRLRDEHL